MSAGLSLDDVTVVCVTYNSAAILETLAGTLAPFRNVTIIDNASTDDTAAHASRLIPLAKIITRNFNAGFGSANNQAMACVQTPFALLLNPDCDIATADVQRLLDCMQRFPHAGVVGPQNWRSETVPQISHRDAFFKPANCDSCAVPDHVIKAEWVHGCCQLIRVSAFREIGGFDEVFFLYYEDDDLCLRMAKAGYECLLEPAARNFHKGGASSAPSLRTDFIKRFHYARSRQIAIRRYVGTGAARWHLAKLLAASIPATVLYSLLLRRRHAIKWAAWGYAALTSALSLDVMPGRGKTHTP
ncbi:MAG: glycosyltransferase family 2 protein [Stenotrophomonas sp.]|uniref:glycosyltransferase family 2 protein n=1 Tax=Stenotrophomonas sp. TaxID=69392 RepID=UPI003D6D7066